MDTTFPRTRAPTGYFLSISVQGYGRSCLSPREMRSRFQSTSRTFTSTFWPMPTTSEGCPTRPQDMSVMWRRPSKPPRSMKAPKSVMFFTTPSRTCPRRSSFTSVARFFSRSPSRITLRETTMLRRRLLSLMILKS